MGWLCIRGIISQASWSQSWFRLGMANTDMG